MATSAMPIGMPGWPELALSTASMASARMALARSAWRGAAVGWLASGAERVIGPLCGGNLGGRAPGARRRAEHALGRAGRQPQEDRLCPARSRRALDAANRHSSGFCLMLIAARLR